MKFLIIDDNNETLLLLKKILDDHGECVTADNGPAAIKAFEAAHESNAPFHLIFLDILMPGMDGHEVLKALRKLEESKYQEDLKAKIAMLTALGSPKNRFASYEEGCEYYLVKPIVKAEIIETVNKTKEWFDVFSE
ncbi:MAG: response regulator [Proteobacteria bacterium]|nr:response regulator [Pseudomonadota bacterium]